MLGLPEKTVILGAEEAKEYIKAKLAVLCALRDEVEDKLAAINTEIDEEINKLNVLENPPEPKCICSRHNG